MLVEFENFENKVLKFIVNSVVFILVCVCVRVVHMHLICGTERERQNMYFMEGLIYFSREKT